MDLKKLTNRETRYILRPQTGGLTRQFWEEITILVHVARWSFLAALVGVLSGASTAAFLNLLDAGLSQYNSMPLWILYLLPPIGGMITGPLVYYLSPRSAGPEAVISDVHRSQGKIPVSVPPVKMASSLVSIVAGFSVGKYGPAAHIGAGLGSFFGWCLDLSDEERKKIVICGISGGFAAVFGTPIAGALFGVEVLFLGKLMYEVLYPSFVSGIVASWTAANLGVSYDFFDWNTPLQVGISPEELLYYIVAGVFFGLVSWVLVESLKAFRGIFRSMSIPPPMKPLVGGIVLSALFFIVNLTGVDGSAFMGLGMESMEKAVTGGFIVLGAGAFLMKILFTSVSLGSGASGGVLTPIFVIGATSGVFLSKIIPLEPALLSQLGITAVLAACANTPVSASIMALELFGGSIGWVAALCAVVAYLVVGHRGIFESQILGLRKTEAFSSAYGGEIGEGGKIGLSYSTVWKLARARHFLRKLRKR